MATGLIGEKAGSQRREPRQLRRSQGSRPRPARALVLPAPAPDQASSPRQASVPGPGAAARPQARPRTPFVLLLVGLLAGGLVCLLLINTTLAEGSFQINTLQQKNSALSQQVQSLQQQTAREESPASIAARAQQLGMRPAGRLRFINLKNGRIYSQPATEPGVIDVPGYTP